MIGKGSKERTVTIGGVWKVTKDMGLNFEVDYGQNEIKPISFGAELDLSDTDKLSYKLSNGAEIKLSRESVDGDSNAHIRYHLGQGEAKIDFGVGIKF